MTPIQDYMPMPWHFKWRLSDAEQKEFRDASDSLTKYKEMVRRHNPSDDDESCYLFAPFREPVTIYSETNADYGNEEDSWDLMRLVDNMWRATNL